MISLKEFRNNYACTTRNNENKGEWELAKPIDGMKLKKRIKDAWNVLLNRGVVVRWK